MAIINFPIIYFPDPTRGRPLFNGQIYVGDPDTDPEIPANQKTLNVIQEDGTVVPVSQPFILSAGGVPVYNGSPVRLDTDGNYSIKILDRLGAQAYYIENVFEGTLILVEDLQQYVAAEFATVTDMIAGNSQNLGNIDFANYVGRVVSISSGRWLITSSSSGLSSFTPLAGTSPQLYAKPINGVWANDFGPIVNNTDCVASINLAMSHFGDTFVKVKVPYVGIINVDSVSLLFERNKEVDLGGNTFFLADGASKYVFSQTDLTTDDFIDPYGGDIEVFNFKLDGNARGGQTRDFSGTDARDMYCGFGAFFFGLRNLKIHRFDVIDTEAWGIAYFKCRDVEAYEGTFDQDENRVGFNGDGITGQAERVRLWNLDGYTNDDFCAITTTRATIGGIEVWNDPISVRVFSIRSIVGVAKGGQWPHFAVGVYPSDNQVVNSVTMTDIKGVWSNGIWRMGNYFVPVGGTNGEIRHISESDLQGFSRTAGQGQRLLFNTKARQLDIYDVRNIVFVDTADNQLLKIEDSILTYLNISDTVYQQAHTPASRKGVIFVDADSELQNVNISNFFHSVEASQIPDADKFTVIDNLGTRPRLSMSGVTKGLADGGNLNIEKDDYWVSSTGALAGDLNINFSENLTLNSANYSIVDQPIAEFHAGRVSYRGLLLSGGSVSTPTELNILTKPVWAKPDQADSFSSLVLVKNSGSASPEGGNLAFKNATQNIDLNNVSGSPTDSYLFLTGIDYKVDPAMP